jgi:hypothetical protein
MSKSGSVGPDPEACSLGCGRTSVVRDVLSVQFVKEGKL